MATNFPNSPSNGDTHAGFTYNSTTGAWDSSAISGATGTTVYSTTSDLPTSGNSAGDQAYVSGNNRLYIWNGTGWYNIALINTTPSISGANSAYNLATDGTATTVTITAADPEGLPITYSLASDTSGNTATVAQGTGASTNVWTITPSTNTAHFGTFSLTFRASDGINLATAVSSFTLAFSVVNSNYTRALITSVGANNALNNSFDDKSTSNHTLTAANQAHQTTFSPYRQGGYSTFFDGSGDWLTIPTSTDLNMGTGDLTVEAWLYQTSAPADYQMIVSSVGSSGNYYITIRAGGTGGLVEINVGGTSFSLSLNNSVAANTWYHFAATRSSGTWNVFINGTSIGTSSSAGAWDLGNGGMYVGRFGGSTAYAWPGYMFDLRVVKGTAVYTSNFTPPTARLTAITNTSLLTCHLPYIGDGSTNSHSITINGCLLYTSPSPRDRG